MAKQVQITWEGETGQTYFIGLDATVEERHVAPSTVTDHAVESGTDVADHIRPEPDMLAIQGVISNTPILLPKDHADGATTVNVEIEGVPPGVKVPLPVVGALVGSIPIGPAPKGTVMGFSPDFDRVAACYEELLKIRNEGILVRVLTRLREYDNMAMESLEVVRDASSGNALNLSLSFKEVRFGSTEEVPVPVIPRGKADKGPKVPIAGVEPPGTERASVLFNAFG